MAKRKIMDMGINIIPFESNFRITCGDKILLSKNDMYNPSIELTNNSDFDEEKFEWDHHGNNRFDEKSAEHFTEKAFNFVVTKISLTKFGDLKISLTNDFCIEVFIDISEDEECWRFFESGNLDIPHLVVTGEGFREE